MTVAKDLNFDVTWLGDELLDEDTVIAKAVGRFILGRLEPLASLRIIPSNAHTFTTATS